MTTMTVSEARAALPELLTRVEGGQEVTITRHGRPVAVLVAPDAHRRRRNLDIMREAAAIRDLMNTARTAPVTTVESMTPQRAEELIEDIRQGREGR